MLSTFFVGSTCHSRSLETQYTDTPLYKVKWKTGLKKTTRQDPRNTFWLLHPYGPKRAEPSP